MQERTHPSDNPPATTSQAPSDQQTPPKKTRRRWLKLLGVLVLLLILLVVALPTMISLGPVRSLVVSQAQAAVPHGRLAIDDWSFGWFSPVQIRGVKVYDEKNVQVLAVDEVTTGNLSLLKLARQQFDLSGVVIDADATHVTIGPDGKTNLHRIFGLDDSAGQDSTKRDTKPDSSKGDTGDIDIPNVHGDITLRLRGAVHVVDAIGQIMTSVQLRQGSGGTIRIDDINKGVNADLKLIYDVSGGPQSTVTIAGDVDAIENNKLALDALTSAIKVTLADIDTRAANPVLALAQAEGTQIKSGLVNGQIAVNVRPGSPDMQGEVVVKGLHVITPQIQDEYRADEIRIPINVAVAGEGEAARLKIDTRLVAPEFWAAITGDVPMGAIDNLARQQMPGSAGTLTASIGADPKKLADSFRNTLRLLPGLTVRGGEIKAVADVLLHADRIELKTNSNLALSASNDGKAIRVPPINLSSGVSVINLADPVKGVRDLSLAMTSDFLNLKGGGPSIESVKIDGSYDLVRLQNLAQQFADLGSTNLAGAGTFAVHSWQADDKTLRADASLKGQGLRVALASREPIVLEAVEGGLSSQLPFDPQSPEVKSIQWLTGTLQLTPTAGKDPLVATKVELRDVDIEKQNVGTYTLSQCVISDVTALQRLIRPVFDVKEQSGLDLQSGAVYLYAQGAVEGGRAVTMKDISASLTNLRINKGDQLLLNERKIAFSTAGTVALGEAQQRVELTKFDLDSTLASLKKTDGQPFDVTLENNVPRGNASLTLSKLDLVRLNTIVRAFAGDNAATLPVVSAGYVTGSLNLKGGLNQDASLEISGNANELTIDKTPVRNEQVALNLNGTLSPASSLASGKLTFRSAFATLEADGISVDLSDGAPTLHRLRGANVRGGTPDIARAITVATALVPGLELPVTASGNLSFELSAKQNPQNKASDIAVNVTGNGLTIANELGQSYAFGKEKLTLNLAVTVEGANEISRLTVSKLDAGTGFASAVATKPIVIANPTADNATLDGQIEARADLESTAKLLQVLTKADWPMAFRGKAVLKQTIATSNNQVTLKGPITIDDFAALDPASGKVQLAEKQVKVTNDLMADLSTKSAVINAITLDMASSQAAKARITGGVTDWEKQRELKEVTIAFESPQAEKLWPIVYAALSPEQQEAFKDAKLTGPITVDVVANGAYPDAPTWNESIKYVRATGAIKVTQADNFYGTHVKNFEQKFTLSPNSRQAGWLVTDRETKSFSINNGEGNLGSIVINLADPKLPISIGRKQKLLTNVELNEILASQLGNVASSVLFADTKKASGILSVSVVECNEVPLADLLNGGGNASFLYSIKDLRLDSGALAMLSKQLGWGNEGFHGSIDDGSLVFKDGVAYQNMTVSLVRMVDGEDPKTKKPTKVRSTEYLKFDGGVNLKEGRFQDYSMWISRGLLLGDLRKYLPNGLWFPVRGSLANTNSILSESLGSAVQSGIKQAAEEKAKDALMDLFNKDKDKRNR